MSHDFPQFITGGQGLWTQFFVLHIAYTTMYIPTSQRNVPEQTLISQTDIKGISLDLFQIGISNNF